ncbi:MAG TPA: hypothetical protein VIL26_07770 [Clostridia bacterium]
MNTKAKFLILNDKDQLVAKAEAECGGVCVINGLSLGKYKLIQYSAPCGFKCGDPIYFELDRLGCTRILDVSPGVPNGCKDKKGEVDFCNCANVAIRIFS